MKKIINYLLLFTLVFGASSCGGNKESHDSNLTPLENQAVTYVKNHLERGDKLVDAEVVEEPMPPSILEQPFMNLRNVVFKAGIDYQSCQTRNLEAGMKMAEEKIENAKQQIMETRDLLLQNIGNSKSLIVLAKVKAHRSASDDPQSLVVVFDPETMEAKEWIPVTTPVQNTVAMMVCAEDNTLMEYAREMNHETEMLVSKTTDPVLKFVLEAKAL